MSECRKCGATVEAGNVLCSTCAGTPSPSGTSVTCSSCGAESASTATLCYNCGQNLRAPASPGSLPPGGSRARVSKAAQPAATLIQPPETDYVWEFVPFAPRLKAGIFNIENANAISAQLRSLVDDYQARGWEYVRMEQVDVTVAAGCLASLFGRSSSTVAYDIVVFRGRRAVSEDSVGGSQSA